MKWRWTGVYAAVVSIVATGTWGAGMNDMRDWKIVNDSVMGGVSQSRAQPSPAGTVLFTGTVSFENNGGFASIRHAARSFSLSGSTGIVLRVRGDGKKYQFRVRTSKRFDGVAYKAVFTTQKNQWQTIRLEWKKFTPTFRGRTVKAPPLRASAIEQLGFMIADKQDGPFRLEIKSIETIGQ